MVKVCHFQFYCQGKLFGAIIIKRFPWKMLSSLTLCGCCQHITCKVKSSALYIFPPHSITIQVFSNCVFIPQEFPCAAINCFMQCIKWTAGCFGYVFGKIVISSLWDCRQPTPQTEQFSPNTAIK